MHTLKAHFCGMKTNAAILTKLLQWPHLRQNLDRWSFSQVSSWYAKVNIKTYDCVSQAILEVDNQEPVLYHDSCFGNEDYDIDVEAYQVREERKIESCRQ